MKTVLLRAPVLTASGYGVHSRQVARWLLEKKSELNLDLSVEALPWGQTPWIIDSQAENGLIGKILELTGNQKPVYDVTFQLQLPNEWNPKLGRFNVGLTAGVETDKCNPAWIEAINRMNLVIVPSEFVKNTFMSSGTVMVPIFVVPEAFPDEFLESGQKQLDLNLDTSFNFLVFGQFTGNNPENDRKNLFYTVKWICEEFTNDKDVGVIIKTNVGRNTKIDRQTTQNLLAKLVMETRRNVYPKIHLLHGTMDNAEVAALYKHPNVKALVSLTRGEGFGLPILEAASCGLPVIATGWSAHTEFLNLGKYIKLDYAMKNIHESRIDNGIFFQGMKWAEPLEIDVKQKLRKFKQNSELPLKWAKDLQEEVKKSYNFKTIASLYDKILMDVLK